MVCLFFAKRIKNEIEAFFLLKLFCNSPTAVDMLAPWVHIFSQFGIISLLMRFSYENENI